MNFCPQCGGYETTAVGVFAHNRGCPTLAIPVPATVSGELAKSSAKWREQADKVLALREEGKN